MPSHARFCDDEHFGKFAVRMSATEERIMPRGDKSSYTQKQRRMAEHIEESAEERGASEEEAARIAWATVNKYTGGAFKKKSTSQIKNVKPQSKTKKASPARTGPAKTSGKTHDKLSEAGKKGAAAAAESVKSTALKKRSAAKKASAAHSKSSASTSRAKSTSRKTTSRKSTSRKTTSKSRSK
jgi:hypothetical protein